MSYRPQRSSRRSSRRGRSKVHSEKGKRKRQKHHSGGKYLLQSSEAPSFEEVVEKTLGRLSSLGGQTFAFSPFSQYFDDWLLSLKSVLSEFESNPAVELDEEFVKARSQLIATIELKLSERQREEDVLENAARMLAKKRNLLVQTDTEYSYRTQNLASERKSEIKRLTRRVRDFEEDLEETNQTQVSIFSPLARRSKSRKKAELTRKLDAAKGELESIVKELETEQEKLRVAYEEKKQALLEEVQSLEEKVRGSEADGSVEDRRVTCEELVKVVQALLQRKSLQ
jgi:hypothetical protein